MPKPKPRGSLDLKDLHAGPGCLTPALGETFAEQASVCLETCGHEQGCKLRVCGDHRCRLAVIWPTTTDDMRRSHADPRVAAENGAYGVAILLLGKLDGLVPARRACASTGIDFWLCEEAKDSPGLLFQNKARLEVSGILRGSTSEFKSRVREKKRQTSASASSNLPARVVVVEFGEPAAQVGTA